MAVLPKVRRGRYVSLEYSSLRLVIPHAALEVNAMSLGRVMYIIVPVAVAMASHPSASLEVSRRRII